jgi:hypothetical protein
MMLALATTALAAAGAPPAFTERALPAGATMPVPTAAQLKYQGEISALIHFGMATFFHDGDPGCDAKNWHGCDTNGGLTTCNSSDVSSFAPTNLNVSAWIDSFQALGATSAVLTAKHGCGFLAWKTNTTLPDGKPYRYHVPDHLPVLEQFVAATTAAGIGHGFYYSLTNNYYLKCACAAVPPQLHALVLTRAHLFFNVRPNRGLTPPNVYAVPRATTRSPSRPRCPARRRSRRLSTRPSSSARSRSSGLRSVP